MSYPPGWNSNDEIRAGIILICDSCQQEVDGMNLVEIDQAPFHTECAAQILLPEAEKMADEIGEFMEKVVNLLETYSRRGRIPKPDVIEIIGKLSEYRDKLDKFLYVIDQFPVGGRK